MYLLKDKKEVIEQKCIFFFHFIMFNNNERSIKPSANDISPENDGQVKEPIRKLQKFIALGYKLRTPFCPTAASKNFMSISAENGKKGARMEHNTPIHVLRDATGGIFRPFSKTCHTTVEKWIRLCGRPHSQLNENI